MTRVTIFDYGAGNLHSLVKAIEGDGVTVRLETSPVAAVETDLLVLPGVGAFTNAAERIAPGREAMRDAIAGGLPTLGICLGMQLLFDESEEGPGAGLGIVPGVVRRLRSRRVPQIGWNTVEVEDAMRERFASLPAMAYFANSYVCDPREVSAVVAHTTHDEDRFVSAVATANAVGVQFHPEKSSERGVRFVRDMVRALARGAAGGRA